MTSIQVLPDRRPPHTHTHTNTPALPLTPCGQGHKLKNPKTELRHKFDYIPARSRVVISGTPIQVEGGGKTLHHPLHGS